MLENSYLRHISAQVSQIVFLAYLTILGLIHITHNTLLFALLSLHYIHVSFLGIWRYLFYQMIFFYVPDTFKEWGDA